MLVKNFRLDTGHTLFEFDVSSIYKFVTFINESRHKLTLFVNRVVPDGRMFGIQAGQYLTMPLLDVGDVGSCSRQVKYFLRVDTLPTTFAGESVKLLFTVDNLKINNPLPAADPVISNPIVTNQRRVIREDFAGVALNPAMWQVVQVGTGQSFAVGGSNLTIETGTTPNVETIIRSVEAFPFPLRVGFLFALSQRIANQEFILEITDSAGSNRAGFISDGTSSTMSRIFHFNGDVLGGELTIITTVSTTISHLDMDCLQDAVFFTTQPINNSAHRFSNLVRTQRIPNPNLLYHIQIRVRNLAVAPASNTTLTLDAINIESLSAQTVEILSGAGYGGGAQSLAVHVAGGAPVGIVANTQSINTAFTDTSVALGVNGIFNGVTRDFTTTHRVARYGAMSVSDQPGTLFIEYSADAAANTWAVIRQDTAAVIDADGVTQHVATLSTPVPTQRARTRYRNGATANTRLRVNSLQGGV